MKHSYEERTGEELPTKGNRLKNPIRISLDEFYAMRDKNSIGRPQWGSAQNNPCFLYIAKDGRWIEEYNATGLPSYFTEATI